MTRYSILALGFFTGVLLFQNCQPNSFTTLSSTNENTPSSTFSTPKISLTTMMAALTNSRNINVNFKVETDSKTNLKNVTCQLNNFAPAPCSTQISQAYSNLADGDYVVRINAEDLRGQKAPELAISLRVDATSPTVSITQGPAAVSGLATANFIFNATDSLSQVATLECSVDNAAFAICNSPMSLAALTQGNHTFQVRATDAAQNTSTIAIHSWAINLMAPALNITSSPGAFVNVKTANFTFNGQANGSAITQFQCSIDDGAFAACTSPVAYNNLAEGSHKFNLRGADINGVFSSPIMTQWIVDTVVPSTPQVVTTTTALTKLTAASFSFSSMDVGGSGIASFQCSIDNGAFAACTSPRDLTNLANGNHSFRVRSLDNAANPSALATINWLVDNVAPTMTLTQTPLASTTSTSATFAFTATDGAAGSGLDKFECSLDNSAFATCTSPLSYNGLAVGNHNFRVQAKDLTGNTSVVSAFNWSISVAVPDWNISPIDLKVGSNGTVDLKATLPAGIAAGGVFSVDAAGSALPAGMTLSANGILSVGSASVSTTAGVIFSYTEP